MRGWLGEGRKGSCRGCECAPAIHSLSPTWRCGMYGFTPPAADSMATNLMTWLPKAGVLDALVRVGQDTENVYPRQLA